MNINTMTNQSVTLRNDYKARYFGLNGVYLILRLFDEPISLSEALKVSRDDAKDLEERLKGKIAEEAKDRAVKTDAKVRPMTLADYVIVTREARLLRVNDSKHPFDTLLESYPILLDTQFRIQQENEAEKLGRGKYVTVYEHEVQIDFGRRMPERDGAIKRFYLSHFVPCKLGEGDFYFYISCEEPSQMRATFGGRNYIDFIDVRYALDSSRQGFIVPLVLIKGGFILIEKPMIDDEPTSNILQIDQPKFRGIETGTINPKILEKIAHILIPPSLY